MRTPNSYSYSPAAAFHLDGLPNPNHHTNSPDQNTHFNAYQYAPRPKYANSYTYTHAYPNTYNHANTYRVYSTGNVTSVTIFYNGSGSQEPDEYVEIRNDDTSPIQLLNWTLSDEASHVFTFPSYNMLPGQTCRVYTNENHPEWWVQLRQRCADLE